MNKLKDPILCCSFLFLTMTTIFCQEALNEIENKTSFNVRTYDGKILPAQVLKAENDGNKLILFINGSTPYDEKGNQGAGWTEQGKIIASKHDFYVRFSNVMVKKGYSIATMTKRSFIYPTEIPRPNFADLALDIYYFILHLKNNGFIENEKDLVIVGYSEGSLVTTKVLAYLKTQPFACVLLGSGSMPVNYNKISVEDFYQTDILRKTNKWSDDQILTEINQLAQINDSLRNMNEEEFENKFKKSKPFGFGYADWESYYIDKEYPLYNAVPNIIYANIPVLICIGENDRAMPLVSAKSTYDQLLDNGFKKGTFRIIKDEVHQYEKYDVFAIIDAWLGSGFKTTDFTLNATDSLSIESYQQSKELVNEISTLSWDGNQPIKSKMCYQKALESKYMDNPTWFELGLKLFANNHYDESFDSFKHSLDSAFIINFASLTWMGHIKDLQNQRKEALEYYQKALEQYPGFPVQHDQWNILLNKSWIEERIRKPFNGIN